MKYFRTTGRRILLAGVAVAVVSVVLGVVVGTGWMMGVMAPLPLVGFGAAMMILPGEVLVRPETHWETAWQATRVRVRAVWLVGLLVGCAGSMLAWMWLVPFITFVP